MIGAIFGDIAGSIYEFRDVNRYDFLLYSPLRSHPTDDTYMTLAVANALMETYGQDENTVKEAVIKNMQEIGRKYPHAGYGSNFAQWLHSKYPVPYNSYGNGSAMRVSSVGWLYLSLEDTLKAAKLTAEVTHNHPEGIKGAQAIAAAIFLARAGQNKEAIKEYISNTFEYDLDRTIEEIRPGYSFYEICQKSVPEAIIAFLESKNYEDAIRKAIYLNGDSDTIACMSGAIAEAYYGVPEEFQSFVNEKMNAESKEILENFIVFRDKLSGPLFLGVPQDNAMPEEKTIGRKS